MAKTKSAPQARTSKRTSVAWALFFTLLGTSYLTVPQTSTPIQILLFIVMLIVLTFFFFDVVFKTEARRVNMWFFVYLFLLGTLWANAIAVTDYGKPTALVHEGKLVLATAIAIVILFIQAPKKTHGIIGKIRSTIVKQLTAANTLTRQLTAQQSALTKNSWAYDIPLLGRVVVWIQKEGVRYLLALLFIVLIGGVLRLYHLDQLSIHQDEVFFIIAAKNYQETGVSRISWNGKQSIEKYDEYTRARSIIKGLSYYWEQSGYTEKNLRFPMAFAGTALIVPVYFVFRKIIPKQIALLTTYMLAFDQHYIYFSRFVRDYTFLVIISVGLFYLTYALCNTSMRHPARLTTYAISFFLLSFFGLSVNFQLFLVFPGLMLYILLQRYRTAQHYIQTQQWSKRMTTISAILTIGIGTLVYHFRNFGINLFNDLTNQGILTSDIKFLYARSLTEEYTSSVLAVVFAIVSIAFFLHQKKASIILWQILLPLPILMWVSKWAPSIRYMLTLRIFWIAIIATGAYYTYYLFLKKYRILKSGGVSLLLFTFLFLNPSFPSMPALPPFTQKAQTDWTHGDAIALDIGTIAPNMRNAFAYIKDNYQKEDAIITRDLTSFYYLGPLFQKNKFTVYYLENNSNQVRNLQTHKKVSFFEVAAEHDRLWMITNLTTYISPTILDYVDEHMINISPMIEDIPVIDYVNYRGEYLNTLYWPTVYVSRDAF